MIHTAKHSSDPTMNLYLQNKSPRRERRTLLIATVLVVVLFSVDFFTGGMIRTLARSVAVGVWRTTDSLARGITGSGILATRSLLAHDNERLKNEIASLTEQLSAYKAAEIENEELRGLAHVALSRAGKTAPVISSLSASPYGTFLIGAGARDGVVQGAVVLSSGGFVVGTVVEVQDSQSLVEEIFAPRSALEVLAGSIPVSLSGSGGGNAVGEAPRGSLIATGTPVYAPQLGGEIVGFVGRTEGSVSNPSVKVYVRTPVTIETLRLVYVVLP